MTAEVRRTMAVEQAEATARRYYSSVDASDLGAALALFARDAEYSRPGLVLRGRRELADFLSARTVASGSHVLSRVLSAPEGERCVVVCEGVFSGDLTSGTGRSAITSPFVDVFVITGSTIVSRSTYLAEPPPKTDR